MGGSGRPDDGALLDPQAVRAHLIVTGRVQGVFFRASAVREASAGGLAGWVRNRSDGSVEVVAQGPRPQVERLIEWCSHGPPAARVAGVDITWEAPDPAERAFAEAW